MPSALAHYPSDAALAHLDERGREHLLVEHLQEVAARASRLAASFGAERWAEIAGLWHDLGKYASDFQNRIREANGFATHLETDTSLRPNHSSAGAIYALDQLKGEGWPLAFAIAGHHAGLANHADLRRNVQANRKRLEMTLAAKIPPTLLQRPQLALPASLVRGTKEEQMRGLELWIRFLFSALCDADFLDTEAFFDDSRTSLREGRPSLGALAEKLRAHLERIEANAPPSPVNEARAEVRRACLEAASWTPGCFSLTVPTGGGKTFASLSFAIAHALAHGMERVIVAIPFTSIIEQTASAYRAALGDDAVLEHHSALDPSRETARNRIACENWDAPIVVTTTVQLFESLFSNRPSSCRKLHRIARSVIVLDEAQTLPRSHLTPLLDVLGTLVADFGVSLVLATATQPALLRRAGLPEGFAEIHEIIPKTMRLFERLKRVRAVLKAPHVQTSYASLANEVAAERDVLAIVHRRDDARKLCELVDAELGDATTVHLSALMCPEHRSRVLADIKVWKERGQAVRVVSTQLVEAGVDLDFAVVYRALGGADALAQAAGRCNREGRLQGLGELRIFQAETPPPKGVPQAALSAMRLLLEADPALDLFEPATYRAYFQQLYCTGSRDEQGVQKARQELRFADVAAQMRLIDDEWSRPIVVPYGDAPALLAQLERYGPSRLRLRALGRYCVSIPRKLRDAWVSLGVAREIAESVVALEQAFAPAYDERFGLVPTRVGIADAKSLVVDG